MHTLHKGAAFLSHYVLNFDPSVAQIGVPVAVKRERAHNRAVCRRIVLQPCFGRVGQCRRHLVVTVASGVALGERARRAPNLHPCRDPARTAALGHDAADDGVALCRASHERHYARSRVTAQAKMSLFMQEK